MSPSGGVWGIATQGSDLYVINGNGLSIYNLSGVLQHQYPLPASIVDSESNGQPQGSNGVSGPVVSPSGDVFVSAYYGKAVAEVTPGGQVSTFDPDSGNPNDIFGVQSSSGTWELAISVTQDSQASFVYDTSLAEVGSIPLFANGGAHLDTEPNGDILDATGTGMVQTWNPTGTEMLSQFGDTHLYGNGSHTGGPYEFYYPYQAVYSGGDIYALAGLSTLTVTSPDGRLLAATGLGGNLSVGSGSLTVDGSNLYMIGGHPYDANGDNVSVVPLSDIADYTAAPHAADNTLGWGAGLSTTETANYFPPGTTPSVDASFESWYTGLAPHLQLEYRVWDRKQIAHSTPPAWSTVALPTTAAGLAKVNLPVPSADTTPGPYQVEAELFDTATTPPVEWGAACLPVTVGAPGDQLNFSALPSGVGNGGPSDPRGIVLNAQLGLDGLRSGITGYLSDVLPACNASAPTAATCGPAAENLSDAPASPYKAAYLANQDHVTYWVQVTGGGALAQALVKNGWWGADVQQLVSHYSTVPSGCTDCAPVTNWEPWNEPNNTGWSDPADYVTQVLEPFYRAVKAAAPDDTVIGGSSLEVSLGWWKGVIAAGGLDYLDVASVHPYPGSNDSWAEDGIPAQLTKLKSMLDGKPLWISEVGWWSGGDYDYLSQANEVANAMVWQKVIGIPVWNYFIDEGGYENFALISAADSGGGGDNYVKPAALAVMTASHELSGRTSLGESNPGLPQTFVAAFSPTSGGTHRVDAVWSDGLKVPVSVTATSPTGGNVPVTFTDQYGKTSSYTLVSGAHYRFDVSDQTAYVSSPSGDTLSFGPTETYGTDFALASQGATATATSSSGGTSPSAVLVDPTDATGYGQGWRSSSADTTPTVTVTLAHPETINRILVDTRSLGSTASGVRDYTVSVLDSAGTWVQEAAVTGQFEHHEKQIVFDPVEASAVRISISEVNLGGYYGGGVPAFCTVSACQSRAFLHAVEVYGGDDTPAQVAGDDLTALGSTPTNPTFTPPAVDFTVPSTVKQGSSATTGWGFTAPTVSGYQGWAQSWDTPATAPTFDGPTGGWMLPGSLSPGTYTPVVTFFFDGKAYPVDGPKVTVTAWTPPTVNFTGPSTIQQGSNAVTGWSFTAPTSPGYQGWAQSWDTPATAPQFDGPTGGWMPPGSLSPGIYTPVVTFFVYGNAYPVYGPEVTVTSTAPAPIPEVSWTGPSTVQQGATATTGWSFTAPTMPGYQGWAQSWDTPAAAPQFDGPTGGWMPPGSLPVGTHRPVVTFFANGNAYPIYGPKLAIST